MNSMKRQKDRTLKDELPGLEGAQYATGDQWRNNSRKNEDHSRTQPAKPGGSKPATLHLGCTSEAQERDLGIDGK